MTVTQIKEKLNETKSKLESDKAKLDELRSERARLAVMDSQKNTSKISALDKQITELRERIAQGPCEIACLQEMLADEQQKERQREHDKLVAEQQGYAAQIEELGKPLVQSLKKSMALNDKLRAAWEGYKRLRTLTNEELLSPNVCEASEGMLKCVYEFLEGELRGIHQRRPLIGIPI